MLEVLGVRRRDVDRVDVRVVDERLVAQVRRRDAVPGGEPLGAVESPRMSWQGTLEVMRTLDEVRRQVGVVYPGE